MEECFQELEKKIAFFKCQGVPHPQAEIIGITDASDVGGGGGTIYQWQQLNPAHCHFCTSSLSRDGSFKHDYRSIEWRLVPLGPCDRK